MTYETVSGTPRSEDEGDQSDPEHQEYPNRGFRPIGSGERDGNDDPLFVDADADHLEYPNRGFRPIGSGERDGNAEQLYSARSRSKALFSSDSVRRPIYSSDPGKKHKERGPPSPVHTADEVFTKLNKIRLTPNV